MDGGRRSVLKGTGGAAVLGLAMAAGLFRPGSAWAEWNKNAFETKSLNDAVKALGGASATESKEITITSPDIAENGAVVPFTIASKLPTRKRSRSWSRRTPTSSPRISRSRRAPSPGSTRA